MFVIVRDAVRHKNLNESSDYKVALHPSIPPSRDFIHQSSWRRARSRLSVYQRLELFLRRFSQERRAILPMKARLGMQQASNAMTGETGR
jgi:hypothetical protein